LYYNVFNFLVNYSSLIFSRVMQIPKFTSEIVLELDFIKILMRANRNFTCICAFINVNLPLQVLPAQVSAVSAYDFIDK
jgi:hypothetical protein